MTALTQGQKDMYWRDGVLMVEDVVTPEELETLRGVFATWVDESCSHDNDYGKTLDGRARFDLEPGHTADSPALRRVQSPEEVSDVFASVMRNARTVDITTYYAEDAIELSPNHLPSTFTCELVRGEQSGRVRCSSYEMPLPEVPKDTSFFAQQEAGEA